MGAGWEQVGLGESQVGSELGWERGGMGASRIGVGNHTWDGRGSSPGTLLSHVPCSRPGSTVTYDAESAIAANTDSKNL